MSSVTGQYEIRPFQAKIVDIKSPSESIEIVLGSSTLRGLLGKDKEVGCDKIVLSGSKTGPATSYRVLQNKSKPKMVKPKKTPDWCLENRLNPKAIISMKRKLQAYS